MNITLVLKAAAANTIKDLYAIDIPAKDILVNATKPEFEGDYTIVLFALIKQLKKSPEVLGNEIGEHITQNNPQLFASFNIIKGFLNLVIADSYWLQFLQNNYSNSAFGTKENTGKKVMVEYSSPNTNKPIHLGHLRNNFLGWSVAEIYKANGYNTIKTCIVNDRGIHICKSMIAWQMFANGATPQSTGTKGDHFVGDYYVKFNDAYKLEVEALVASGKTKEEAEKQAPIMLQTQQMLLDWEAGNPAVMQLWKEMNGWVYEGFDVTYKIIGSDFDKTYYESNTYLLGKKIVAGRLGKKAYLCKKKIVAFG